MSYVSHITFQATARRSRALSLDVILFFSLSFYYRTSNRASRSHSCQRFSSFRYTDRIATFLPSVSIRCIRFTRPLRFRSFHCTAIMSRKFFVGGNWKMNGSKKVADELLGTLVKGPLDPNVGEWILKRFPVILL